MFAYFSWVPGFGWSNFGRRVLGYISQFLSRRFFASLIWNSFKWLKINVILRVKFLLIASKGGGFC